MRSIHYPRLTRGGSTRHAKAMRYMGCRIEWLQDMNLARFRHSLEVYLGGVGRSVLTRLRGALPLWLAKLEQRHVLGWDHCDHWGHSNAQYHDNFQSHGITRSHRDHRNTRYQSKSRITKSPEIALSVLSLRHPVVLITVAALLVLSRIETDRVGTHGWRLQICLHRSSQCATGPERRRMV